MKAILDRAVADLSAVLPLISGLGPQLERLGRACMTCWNNRGKLLIAGNGGSAADAMHFAEELVVRYAKNRRALAAMALADPTAITCAGNDFGYDTIFSRQIEAFGNPGDIFIGMSTSGNSSNILRAIEVARKQSLLTVAFTGKDGGKMKGLCDIELIVPSPHTPRIQECHKLLYHALCEWVDTQVD
jgi:D-sedoheptulose 7-phosphate isomerase